MFGIGKLLMLPASLPAAGIRFCFNKVIEMAENEMTDDGAVKDEILLLNMRLEDGEIDEAEFRRQEAPLLARFSEIRAYRRQRAEEDLAAQLDAGPSRSMVVEMPEELEPPA